MRTVLLVLLALVARGESVDNRGGLVYAAL
jgi:hypothetical protein